MKDIFQYSDYRKFLADRYETMKSNSVDFTFRYLSKKAGINSSSFFKLIIDGKRNLSKDHILKTCFAFDLNENEAEYFECLVLFNQAKTVKAKNEFFDTLIQLQNSRNTQKIKEDQYVYFSEWYHCVIRELVPLVEFNDDFGKLGRLLSPSITRKQARDSVHLLLKLGFLKFQGGRYYQAEPNLSTPYGINSHHIINYQIKMLKLAQEAFDRFSSDAPITNTSTTLSLSSKNFQQYLELSREFRNKILQLREENDTAKDVYQLNMNLFPLTKLSKKRGKNE